MIRSQTDFDSENTIKLDSRGSTMFKPHLTPGAYFVNFNADRNLGNDQTIKNIAGQVLKYNPRNSMKNLEVL